MRLTAIILLSACITASAKTGAQGVTLNLKDAPLEKVFTEIRKQTGYNFLFSSKDLKEAGTVTVKVSSASIDEVLALCFKDKPFSFAIENKNIVIKKKENQLASNQPLLTNLPPPVDVKGRITNEKGEPVAGASVKIKGTDIGTSTNDNGEFVLNVLAPDMILVISGINIETTEVPVSARTSMAIKVKTRVQSLNEVVINKGYYTEIQRLTVGNVGKVTAKDIEKQPVSNPLLALQGRVPGLFISQANGLPGGGINVQIQGQNSILYGNDPLYVIDGVPYPSQRLATNISNVLGYSGANIFASAQTGNPLSAFNPNDIESIEVLKDADATSIYGSRAANGAILITTKKGKQGKSGVDVNIQTGWGKMTRRVDMLNTQQYLKMRREGKVNDNSPIFPTDYDINGVWDTTRYTDWQKVFLGGTAKYNDAQLNFTGGNSAIQYLVGGNYHRETTVFPGDFAYRKGSIHFNLGSTSINQKFHIQLSGNYLTDNNQLSNLDFTDVAIYSALAPDAPALYNPDGTINWAPAAPGGQTTWSGAYRENPLVNIYRKLDIQSANLIGNSVLSYQILPELEAKVNLGYNKLDVKENSISPLVAFDPYYWQLLGSNLRSAQYSNSSISTWLVEPQLNFRKTISKGDLNVLLGSTFQKQNSDGESLAGRGYTSDFLLEDIKSAASVTVMNTIASTYKYNAVFGRLNFIWDDKYIFNATGRRDGSSRFGPKNQFHNFGSAGLGWIFSKEKSITDALPFLSFGKVRASYGTTGSDQIPDYLYLSQYPSNVVEVPYQGVNGLSTDRLTNPYIKWEETKKMQAGIDLGLFKDRVMFTVNYFRNRSSNQLLQYSLPFVAGFNNILQNLGATIQNDGWELAVTGRPVKTKEFLWTSSFNLTVPRNKLISFPNIENTFYGTTLSVGQPFTLTAFYRNLGADPTTGIYLFADSHGNPSANADPAAAKIDLAPKLFGGFQNSFAYKGFELDFFFQFSKQTGSNFLIGNLPGKGFTNQPLTALDRWQKSGDVANIQKFYGSNIFSLLGFRTAQMSDLSYSDASYIRLKNASLSWKLPVEWTSKVHMQTARVYVQGQNLLTFTNYIGLDPETRTQKSLPPLTMITTGVQVKF